MFPTRAELQLPGCDKEYKGHVSQSPSFNEALLPQRTMTPIGVECMLTSKYVTTGVDDFCAKSISVKKYNEVYSQQMVSVSHILIHLKISVAS